MKNLYLTHTLTHSYLFFCYCVSAECMRIASPNLYPTHLGSFVFVCVHAFVLAGAQIFIQVTMLCPVL